MTDFDIVTRLRAVLHNDRSVELMNREAADEIERLRHDLDGARLAYRGAGYDRDRMRAERDEARHGECVATATLQGCIEERTALTTERDEARRQTGRILNEIDCRIEHGAESNGHLEAIYNLFKENSNV